MEHSTETALSLFFPVSYLLNANVSVTTATHMLAMGEILLVLYMTIHFTDAIIDLYILLTENLIVAWMVMVRPALLAAPSLLRSFASHLGILTLALRAGNLSRLTNYTTEEDDHEN